jgi:hypothetical protein
LPFQQQHVSLPFRSANGIGRDATDEFGGSAPS